MSLVMCLMDDTQLCRQVSEVLTTSGFEVSATSTRGPVLELLEEQPTDLVLLDTGDRPLETRRICQLIHSEYNLPILLLTNQSEHQEFIEHLKAGASDCVVKPLRASELTARVHAAIKRKTGELPSQPPRLLLSCGDLALDTHNRLVTLRGERLNVSRTGFRLLLFLMQHEDQIISRETLLTAIWGFPANSGDPNIVDTAIRRLRDTLCESAKKPVYLHTVWGSGYRFGARSSAYNPTPNL